MVKINKLFMSHKSAHYKIATSVTVSSSALMCAKALTDVIHKSQPLAVKHFF